VREKERKTGVLKERKKIIKTRHKTRQSLSIFFFSLLSFSFQNIRVL
jgi:hypothetical protein